MPNVRNYNAGSIVYFQEDRGEDIFVLQKGKIVLISTVPGEQEEKRVNLKLGEFFGVKSSLGYYPREETAQAVTQTQLVVFGINEFQSYVLRNTRLIVRMLTVFSHELRDIHHKTRTLLKKESEMDSAFELLRVAEDFYRNHHLEHACYAFECYLKYYGDSKNSKRAKELLKLAKQGLVYPTTYPPLSLGASIGAKEPSRAVANPQQNLQASMEETSAIHSFFAAAQAESKKGNVKAAITMLQKCLMEKNNLKTEGEHAVYEKAHFELGVNLTRDKQYQEAVRYLSDYIKSHPTGNYIRNSLYQLGIVYESEGRLDKSRALYYKVATMQPHDFVTKAAREKLQKVN